MANAYDIEQQLRLVAEIDRRCREQLAQRLPLDIDVAEMLRQIREARDLQILSGLKPNSEKSAY